MCSDLTGSLEVSHHDRRPVRSWPETVGHRRQRAALGRIWNYWLGGKDDYPVDREAGDQFSQVFPNILAVTRALRAFLARAVEYLARDAQIQQFLDIVTGLPTADNTHEVAQRLAPASRIVYVDNDPVVLVHARALLLAQARAGLPTSTRPARPGQDLGGCRPNLGFHPASCADADGDPWTCHG